MFRVAVTGRALALVVCCAVASSCLPPAVAAKRCQAAIDSHDPVHGPIRSGPDIACHPLPDGPDNLQVCIDSCCGLEQCRAFSFNSPWVLNVSYLGCRHGLDCCCLKRSAPTLGPNTYPMNITTGLVSPGCATDHNCSLNGECQASGQCKCDAEWQGPACGQLRLVRPQTLRPAYPPPAFVANTTSWGASVVLDSPSDGTGPNHSTTNTYHMFLAEMTHSCGMSAWSTNSIIRHAVSSSPEGPFVRKEVVRPEFAHNPTAVRAPDGTYLIYHIGCGNGRPGYPPCTDCQGGKTGKSCHGPGEQMACSSTTTNLLYASSLDGPWKEWNANFTLSPTMTWPGVDNPTVTFFPNGSLLMLGRGGDPRRESESDGVITAPSWRGPYTFHTVVGSPGSPAVEDPFVWQDHRGNFHALFHKFTDEHPGSGGHAFSTDGFSWTLTDEAAYTTVVTTADGTEHPFNRRERPHLLFDSTGTRPRVLYTTLTNWSSSGANLGHDNAFSFAQAIDVEA
eukprot:m.99073 g.99073  ORF g.99073 m.99073 type:complete len:507 (+) comp15314_c0_seq1:60-1580(+)